MERRRAVPCVGWQTWLFWLLILVARAGQASSARATEENFRFTHQVYNGTVPENAVGKVYVKTSVRMGIFLSEVSRIQRVDFDIKRGDNSGIFHAEGIRVQDFYFVRVRTKTKTDTYGMLNRERRQTYYLRIRAVGRLLTGSVVETFTDLNITLLDQNELSPLFPPRPFNVSIPEDTPLHSSIAEVKATDAEVGINGEIYYSLVSPTPMFAIHPTSGVVTLLRPLMFQHKKYRLEIHAEDRGLKSDRPESPLSNTVLEVNVTPVNFHPPIILVQKLPTLMEDASPGSIFAVLTITDPDVGLNGEIDNVSVLDNKGFRIMSTASSGVYNVIVTSRLDREEQPEGFNITILAVDRGQPPKSSTILIPVRIQDVNDNSPAFEKGLYKAELLEVVPVRTPVLFVQATDADEGQNGEVRYRLKENDEWSKRFSIDDVSGLISTAAPLDAEVQNQIILVVYAEDRANSGTRLTGETKVIINVLDFNDNAPQFTSSIKDEVFVNENVAKGTLVTAVTATDADSGDNGHVSYSIHNFKDVPFEIDAFTGEIKTLKVFDFETMRKQYSVHVRASDWGTPFRHWTEELVTISVRDTNDNSPEFEKTRCKGYLSREAAVGTVIVVLTAIDFDAGNIISYSISEGNDDGCFAVEPSTGSVKLTCSLAASPVDSRQMSIVANDGEHRSVPTTITLQLVNKKRGQHMATADVSVTCQDTDVASRLQEILRLSSNNNKDSEVSHDDLAEEERLSGIGEYAPEFEEAFPVYITVPEDAAVGSVVFKVTATDKDEGYAGQILFVISQGNEDGAFKVDTFSGDLKIFSPLDHERKSEYNLTITAQDVGDMKKSVSKVLTVYISDENDNAPQFEEGVYEQNIFEDVQVNTTVLQVYATDKDSGLNARIQYSILSHGEDFFVEADSGMLKVKNTLDREKKSSYTILVRAEDSGLHVKLSSTASVIIRLNDVNDNFPEFVPKMQTVRVREDLPIGTVVTTLTAQDLDEGENGQVTYALVDGASNKFEVDQLTGAVRIRENLDFETTQVYNLSVRAEDGGVQSLVSMCLLNIEVVDVNENHFAPEFDSFMKRGSVAENAPVGTYVMQVRAHDRDEDGTNGGRITYSIRDGSGLGRFTIDANGTIRTRQVLDREAASHFWLTVHARDGGLVPQVGRLEVLVEVEDVNDNVPQSLSPAYYASVQENSRHVQSVVRVQARDGDLPRDGRQEQLRFAITGGNPQNFFQIDPLNGMISTTSRVLDREKQEEHALEVTISDNGSPPLSSTTRVVIKVIDVNEHKPRFPHRVSHITVLAQDRADGDIFIYRTVAYDRDEGPNAEVTYTLRSSSQASQFYVNSTTGEIYSRKDLKKGDVFDIVVRAMDNGVERKKSQQKVQVEVKGRPRASSSPPSFKQRGVTERITESDRPGQLIILLSAEDGDARDSLYYAIEGGNEDKVFTVQPNHGSILLARPVDWEKRSFYNLTVSVTDGVHKDFTWVYIEVLDVNDNEPVFSHQLYKAQVPENSQVGRHIMRVSASDRDKDDRLLYSIASAASVTSLNKFQIDAMNGVIMVSQRLDREEMHRHLLTVMVRDQGVPSKKSFARVEIDVEDDNDHAPMFLSDSFEGSVFETASIGSSVVQVVATDQDKGSNSELAYSILSGNADSTFSMDEAEGIISVAKQLDRSVQPVFHLVVMATDHGQPPQSSTAAVVITVTVSNNAPPKFLSPEMVTELKENLPAGTVLDAVRADCQSTVVYTLMEGNTDDSFFLNPNSGVLSTTQAIDYEQHQFFNLTVLASNIVGATAVARVMVHVSDENDNHPQFTALRFYGNISEAAEAGSMVLSPDGLPLVIQALDADSGNNALLDYEILEAEARKFFMVDVNTGAVQSSAVLDHEKQAQYNFTVQVHDRGSPRLSAQAPAKVVVSVMDVNDNPPRFSQPSYTARVVLPTYHDVTVLKVEATDPDTVSTKALTYSIVGGNEGNMFAINPQSGVLHVEQTKDMQERYDLKVQASDGHFDTVVSVVITVEQSVDSGLHFTKDRYSASVTENDKRVQNLAVVQPIAPGLLQHFTFSLLNNHDLFTVGSTSGVVQTKGLAFDREEKENYTLVVQVTDSNPEPRTAHAVVLVRVEDVNDNAPMFVKQPFRTVVPTDAEYGETVKRVTATDADLGENGNIRYFLPSHLTDNGKDTFAINQYNGDIVVKDLSEDDRNTNFLLTVEAVDQGTPPLSTTVEVPIHVVDSSSPVFESQHMEVQIPENTPVHSAVQSVQAVSPQGQKLIYSIVDGDRYGDFAVDFNTDMQELGPCLILVAGQLDRESQESYQLVIRASDVSSASYSDMTLSVLLQDVNDNTPMFDSLRYTHTVSEVARVGTSILQVAARDADEAANSLIHYSLAPTSPDSTDPQHFVINSETGVIALHRSLDHEEQAEFTFLAVATDSGMPARSSTARVKVIVLDLNDNAPRFAQPSFNCYITDQAQRGQLVTKVTGIDVDASDKGKLLYSIIGGNEKQAFSIRSRSGLITVSEHRQPEFGPAYVLNVSVSDGVYTSFSRVAIGVRNTNRHVPRFTQQQEGYHAEVSEMISVGTSVVSVSALDADRGNYGMLTYTLPSQRMAMYFSIDADTGEITTRQILDQEKKNQFQLTVAATDNGGQMGFATVTVTVRDENDNMPQFLMEEYRANIHFNASIGTTVIQVKAEDADLGANGYVRYMLHSGEDPSIAQLFSVNEETGDITVKASLTFAVNKVYQFFVRARDQGQPVLENHVPVEILVMGSQDAPPTFPSPQSVFFIQEDEQVGGVIATLRADSRHSLTYTIVPGMTNSTNNPASFSIDNFGQIRIVRELDREITPAYILALRAQTETSPPLVAHMHVHIQVRDVNDNYPQFESQPYRATVVESSEVGTRVIQVKATDADLSRTVSYSFGPGMEAVANVFSIEKTTGWISLLSKLDRETKSEYNLTVVATDTGVDSRIGGGRGTRLTSTTNVIVTVTDFNDNAPRFDRQQFSTAVNEGALQGTVILTLTSTDKDTGVNADVTYYIVRGDPLNQFQIHSNGEMFVNKALDRETHRFYKLVVAATDGGFVTHTKVMVTVLDDNDNAPECQEPFVDVIENENVAVGKPVAHIRASDADEAGTVNARIHYTLSGEGADMFMLEKESGILRIAQELDREMQQKYQLTVTATDGGGLTCMTEVQIFLRDVNDNPPEFTDNLRDTLTVQEDARVNTLLTRVTTVDKDTGINRNTRYKLRGAGPSLFSMDPKSGILSLVGTLDREQHPEYDVTIVAYNEISPELSATALLKVVVLDVNDNPPTFERTSYYAVVPEDVAVGMVVGRVRATSLDIGANAAITYSIAAGNQQGKFAIGAQNGELKVAEPLDHELSREYFLTILARDHGSPPLSNTAIISINITDINDNPPRFSQDTYSATVSELAQVGTEVFKVMATDADSYANSVITYSIIDGNSQGHFLIGPQDGVIQVARPLDREAVERLALTIQARDSGSPMLHTTAVVSVTVEDANDNPPVFSSNNYTAQVQEGRRTGIEILTFTVTDLDTSDNGAPFTFDIVAGNKDGEFHVSSKGVLSTAGKLSKQVKERYQLTVRVFDSGSPPLHSDTKVTIHVVDDSVYPPEVRNLSIHISSCMDAFPGGVIGQIEARDRDPYDTLSFSIVSPNRHLFDVHRDDGRLIALTGLDEGEYIVNISITDQKYTRYGRVLVTVVCISKEIVDNAVTLQLANMIPEQFYASYKRDFQRVLKEKLNVRLNDVEVINVQPSAHTIQASNNNRPRRSTPDNDLDVLFAVRRSLDRFFNPRSLKRKVQKFADELEIELGVRVLRVFSDVCTRSTCETGTCVGSVVFDDTNLVPVVVNGESFVSARHFYTHQCVCVEDECQSRLCGDKRCEAYEVCSQDVFGTPACQCPEGRNGPQCQNIIPLCSGSKCPVERPMTFSGRSYAKWTMGHPTNKRMSLSLRFRTRQHTAILMYAKGQVDYSILAIEEGNLVYRFNCGSGEGQVWIPVDLSDGQWHRVSVERTGRLAEILLDEVYTAMGTAPGVNEVLNLDSEEVFFGAKVDILRNGYRDISKGFEGCMEDIRMFNVPLPFMGSNDIAHSQEFEVVEFHCKDTHAKAISVGMPINACSSSPCLNGGVCQTSGLNSYICVCRGRFKGDKCETDPDPCQDFPCHNQGLCRVDGESPNSYTCRCSGNLLGMRCTYGINCRPNPCQHGGTCIEGPTSALCHCAPGFAGLYCDKTMEACDSAPCVNGGVCQGLSGGRFHCNCSLGYTGRQCEEVDLSPITSTSAGISPEEIYGIIGVVAGLLFLVLIFVSWRVWKRRKRERGRANVTSGIARDNSDVLLNGLMKDSSSDFKRKVSNPDLSVPVQNIPSQPPPVPNRPVSYTPSTHDSLNVLNNLDSVRNYGSAADDLETSGIRQRIPDFTEYLASFSAHGGGSHSHPHSRPSNSSSLAPSLPPPPPSNPPSDTESLHKAPWEFEYPNILGSYEDDKHRDNMAKQMPGLHSPQISSRPVGRGAMAGAPDASSMSSLPVSESEDDLNVWRAQKKGYHWDTSDWAPRTSLPNISEIPANEVVDSSSSTPPSDDSNEHVPAMAAATASAVNSMTQGISAIPDPDYMTDSEYVGETENELDLDDRDELNPPFADLPSYDQLLSLRDLNDSYELPQNLNVHPDQYLPYYHPNFDQDSVNGLQTEEENGNLSDEQNNEVDAAVAQSVAERTARRQPPGRVFLSPGYVTSGEYTTDVEPPSRASFIDDMSMSVGGYTSNASCSDISGLCEIEDSEINNSDDDDDVDDDNEDISPCLPSHLHTQV
ncbi:protocadherin Fat 1-like isoform X2 [Babylonia areolata]|uniref:protocadherin Fat 1-like isoform X2 n=1 Tax=Babylonia areolata TaxID=304850 RepID=UPI003FCF5F9C